MWYTSQNTMMPLHSALCNSLYPMMASLTYITFSTASWQAHPYMSRFPIDAMLGPLICSILPQCVLEGPPVYYMLP